MKIGIEQLILLVCKLMSASGETDVNIFILILNRLCNQMNSHSVRGGVVVLC